MSTKKAKKAKKVSKSAAKKKAVVDTTIKVEPIKVEKKAVAKKVVAKKVEKENVVNNNSYVVIDYPVENDIISSGSVYVLKIGASNDFNAYVEVSFNDGEWNLCRFASGYWWYDWSFFQAGKYTVKARIVSAGDGKVIKMSDTRKFKVN